MYTTASDYTDISTSSVALNGIIMPTEKRDALNLSLRKEDFVYLAQAAVEFRNNLEPGDLNPPQFTRSYAKRIGNLMRRETAGELCPWCYRNLALSSVPASQTQWHAVTGRAKDEHIVDFLSPYLYSGTWPSNSEFDTQGYIARPYLAAYDYLFNAPFVFVPLLVKDPSASTGLTNLGFEAQWTQYTDVEVQRGRIWSPTIDYITTRNDWCQINLTDLTRPSINYFDAFLAEWKYETSGRYNVWPYGGRYSKVTVRLSDAKSSPANSVFALLSYMVGYGDVAASSYSYSRKFVVRNMTREDADGDVWSLSGIVDRDVLLPMAQEFTDSSIDLNFGTGTNESFRSLQMGHSVSVQLLGFWKDNTCRFNI